ncbi:MAG: ADP-ribosylglycohydrolase family protein [Chloroflexi bacterium]|nr:ADP-ribosylglycohydrolase family protein [Chloroflexota bacterium]
MSPEPFYAPALRAATEAALAAGALLRAEYHRPDGIRKTSHDHADVDVEVERMLRERLLAAFPAWAYRGEETGAQAAPLDAEGPVHCWMVDPNDGTRAFIVGVRGAAVSIGLLRDGEPVLGVVYAPCCPDDGGDLITWAEGCGPVRRNGQEVQPVLPERLSRHTVLVLSWDVDRVRSGTLWVARPGRYRSLPSIAYRLALVAVGEADGTLSGHGPSGWDYCAGHALVRGAGGVFQDERGAEVRYTPDGHSRVRACFAGSAGLAQELRQHQGGRHLWGGETANYQAPRPLFPKIVPALGATEENPGVLARAQGALLGQLAGDSLGSLAEFQSPEEIRRRYPNGLRDLEDGGTWGTIAGQPTDDSEMALLLARMLARGGGYDAETAAQAYGWWLRSRPFDVGTTTRQALTGVTDAVSRRHAAAETARSSANPASQANGSLMRISPLGVFAHALPPQQVAEMARADSALTHPNLVCQDACAVYSVAVSYAVRTGAAPAEVYGEALRWAEQYGQSPQVLDTLRAAATSKPEDFQHNQGWVLLALQNAFWQLLHAPNLEEAVIDTVRQGGDTDTTAAIAGALLGAVYGRDAVPLRWRRLILSCRTISGVEGVTQARPADFWGVDLLLLAERLAVVGRLAAAEGGVRQ